MGLAPHVQCLNVVTNQGLRRRCIDLALPRCPAWLPRRHGRPVDIVLNGQVIEMKDMGLDVVCTLYQIAYYTAILRYLVGDTEGAVKI